jgi:predicted restriction endonuclease
MKAISQEVSTAGLTPSQTLSRTLQELRDDGYIEFDDHGGYTLLSSVLTPKSTDISSEYSPPDRITTTVHRIMRDSEIVVQLKRLYLYRCQICSTRLELISGYYCEAHHLKPLGVPHNGPDTKGNIIIVCPNHHVLLDYGALKIDYKSLELNKHAVIPELLNYHNKGICRKP